ncbi:hypothetical protein EGT49_02780 [Companilactobacillus suantsaicola]|uniref:Uncharacterized protein n=1 Tax=Companilactobacillus suantsaicola TaxID=2487723 RepID=A0A4Z0JRC4_9LACO|nr:hypothetical protein EGT49_02780 [Companilactobacillus suantsaicola]
MLSREISLNALAFSERPILETIPAFGIGFKLRPQRSSVSQSCCGRRQFNTYPNYRTNVTLKLSFNINSIRILVHS